MLAVASGQQVDSGSISAGTPLSAGEASQSDAGAAAPRGAAGGARAARPAALLPRKAPGAAARRLEGMVSWHRGRMSKLQEENAVLRGRAAALALMGAALSEATAHGATFRGAGRPAAAAGAAGAAFRAGPPGAGHDVAGAGGGRDDVTEARALLGLPPLGPGESLLCLDSMAEADAEAWLSEPGPALHARWRALAQSAAALLLREARGDDVTGQMHEAGVVLKGAYSMLLIWRFDHYARIAVHHLETGGSAVGTGDAPLAHWEAAVRAARLTQAQAAAMAGFYADSKARIAALHSERAALSRALAELPPPHQDPYSPGPPPGQDGGGPWPAPGQQGRRQGQAQEQGQGQPRAAGGVGAAGGGGDALDEPQPWAEASELVELLDANTKAEQEQSRIGGLSPCALMLPAQWARLVGASYPWPINGPRCQTVVEHFLRLHTENFTDG